MLQVRGDGFHFSACLRFLHSVFQSGHYVEAEEATLIEELLAQSGDDEIMHRQRNPHVRATNHVSSLEALGGHADNGEALPIEQHTLTDHVRIRAKLSFP